MPVILPMVMDTNFISFVEMKNEGVKFKRVDSALSDALTDGEASKEDTQTLCELFKKALGNDELKN